MHYYSEMAVPVLFTALVKKKVTEIHFFHKFFSFFKRITKTSSLFFLNFTP